MMRVFLLICATALLGLAQSPAPTDAWKLVWSDEFNGPANAPPDPANWNHDLGGGGWGNGEQETYTGSSKNAFQDGEGHLVIRAVRDASGKYTSARLRSGKTADADTANHSWQFGKVEARIKLPFGPGIWPAFWMLGANIAAVPWPGCGEVDILENFGSKVDSSSTIHGTIHGPGYSGSKSIGAPFRLPGSKNFNDDFHLFSVEWSPDSIEFFADGASYEKLTPASLPTAGSAWAFNHPFFVLLNLAIGGSSTFLGAPQADTSFPQDMLVDYVRIYSRPVRSRTD